MSAKPAAPCAVVAIAYSGGRDSTALLHATLKTAQGQGIGVVALHVHHGLQALADEWLLHCEQQCAAWQRKGLPVEFAFTRLHLKPAKGHSVEAVARDARYEALRLMAMEHGADTVLLAHHRRDQAETFLLQALRGAGAAGLAAMPRAIERAGIFWLRPWLEQPRERIEAYLRKHRLRYIDDTSNEDVRHARNRVRLNVWPVLAQNFPQAEDALSGAARWAQEANACLEELGLLDLEWVSTAKGVRIAALLELSPPRGRNALRAWYLRATGHRMPASLIDRLWKELPHCKAAQWPAGEGVARLYRGVLSFGATAMRQERPSRAVQREKTLSIRRAGSYRLPGWGGTLIARRVQEGGLTIGQTAHLHLVERSGAEQFQIGPNRPPRSLKKQFQAVAVPAWQRHGPLIYSGSQLVFVPGLGIDARAWADQGQAQLGLYWQADGSE